MALTGQLSDMSLAELIEFFCNQRKTGRLKIDYQRGHSVFFIKEGELVDAKVGALSGSEAVYFSLTLPNAAFDFSPDVLASRRTINESWTQVVLEGLRRLDEGLSPTEADAFGAWSPSESELAQMLDQVEHLDAAKQQKIEAARQHKTDASKQQKPQAERAAASLAREESPRGDSSPEPFPSMVESASGGSKKKFMVAGVAAALLLACAVVAFPLLNRPAKGETAPSAASSTTAAPAQTSPATGETAPDGALSGETPEAAPAGSAEASAAASDTARREALDRERRERRERERRQDEAAKKDDAATTADPAAAAAAAAKPLTPATAAPSGPKSVRVTVTYDEAGRVTQASVAGVTPGAEAYGSTAVRMARGKHFPAGKAGSTVITIPVN
jgi:hypothetical protein